MQGWDCYPNYTFLYDRETKANPVKKQIDDAVKIGR